MNKEKNKSPFSMPMKENREISNRIENNHLVGDLWILINLPPTKKYDSQEKLTTKTNG